MKRRLTMPGGPEGIGALQLFVHLANAQELTILHDKGCLCPDGFPLARCSCECIELLIPRDATPIEIQHKIG